MEVLPQGRWKAVLTAVALAVAGGASAQVQDQIVAQTVGRTQTLTWNDADDALSGQLTPERPVAGSPVNITFTLGAFAGKSQRQIRVAVRHAGVTVLEKPLPAAERMTFSFTPEQAGDYAVDLLFQSTRAKVIHLAVPVAEAEPSKYWGLAILGGLALLAVGVMRSMRVRPTTQTVDADIAGPSVATAPAPTELNPPRPPDGPPSA